VGGEEIAQLGLGFVERGLKCEQAAGGVRAFIIGHALGDELDGDGERAQAFLLDR
jgi:hypothetical protein